MSKEAESYCGEGAAREDEMPAAPARSPMAGARPFIARQSMVAFGSADLDGACWASLLFGKPGFLRTGEASIAIQVPQRERDLADPLWVNIADGAELGMLFLEAGARRHYRASGAPQHLDARRLEVAVRDLRADLPAFQPWRELGQLGEFNLPVQAAFGTLLRGAVERIVGEADTLFMAGHHPERGIEAAHWSGLPGGVCLLDARTLRISGAGADTAFAALGAGAGPARVGICIPSYAGGQLLQMTGQAVALRARRCWEFRVARWILRDTPQALSWRGSAEAPAGHGAC